MGKGCHGTSPSIPSRQRYGVLSQQEKKHLHAELKASIRVTSVLPDDGDGNLPAIDIQPANFVLEVAAALKSQGLGNTAFLIDSTATWLCGGRLAETRPSNEALLAADDDARDLSVLFLLQKPQGRDALRSCRDVVLSCLRKMITEPEARDPDRVPDHLLAGAYVRKMMVVTANEHGPGAMCAHFSVASFEENPARITLSIVACPDLTTAARDAFGFPLPGHAAIALNATALTEQGNELEMCEHDAMGQINFRAVVSPGPPRDSHDTKASSAMNQCTGSIVACFTSCFARRSTDTIPSASTAQSSSLKTAEPMISSSAV